jgi:predicted nucleotidyltransferase/predicted DNA-binding transcriptional regulator
MVKKGNNITTLLNLKIVYNLFMNKKGLTINRLAENIKTDYKNTYTAVDLLFKNGIIKKEKVGNYNLCTLEYGNESTTTLLEAHNLLLKNDFKKDHNVEYQIISEAIIDLRSQTNPFFVCLVFGSYSKNEEKDSSDIDLLFLTNFSKNEQKIKSILSKANAPYQKRFHLVEQDILSFVKDLKNNEKLSLAVELSKELPIVFYGEDIFFSVILESIK